MVDNTRDSKKPTSRIDTLGFLLMLSLILKKQVVLELIDR